MIEFSNVTKSFADVHLLRGVSFNLGAGERASILGPGGCGKTSVLKLILGLMTPDSGTVRLMDTELATASDADKRAILCQVGVAFQQGALFDFMTVRENLFFAMEHMRKYSFQEMDSRVKKLLAAVKIGRTEHMFPYELSGGMQRRVGIVRALCTDPLVAVFDEPTAGLDPVTSTIILNMILALAGSNPERALLVATSNVEIAMRFAERVIILHEGRIIADGPWKELLLTGSDWVRHFLSVRLVGLDIEYVRELHLPEQFIAQHW